MSDPYRIFPRATGEERAQLKMSIEAVGLRNPVVIDEAGHVIDGHERRDACTVLGHDWLAGADVRIGLTDIQKKALAIELNLWRRPVQLSRRQRNELLEVYLVANPHLSETRVADLFGVNQSTVNRRKQALMQTHKLSPVTATVGRDGLTRKVGERRRGGARVIVKGRGEFEALQPALAEVGADLHGLQRRPKRIQAIAARKRALAEVEASSPPLSTTVQIEHTDFHQLKLADNSVDVVLTDVVWTADAEQDWVDLAALSSRWLRDDGLFCSIIGTQTLPLLMSALSRHLRYQWTISLQFAEGYRSWSCGVLERWRPVVVFSKTAKTSRTKGLIDLIVASRSQEKQYHIWQQPVEVCKVLAERLTRPGDVVLDPHLGTGTNAVACSLLGGRTFIGCDIDERQIQIARHRVSSEGQRQTA